MARRRRNPSLTDVNMFLSLAALGVGGYLFYTYVWPQLKKLGNVGTAVTNAGAAVGGSLYEALNPGSAGASVTYIVTMPDGSKQAVNNTSLDNNNQFTVNNQTYQLQRGSGGAGNTATLVSDVSAEDPNAIDNSIF